MKMRTLGNVFFPILVSVFIISVYYMQVDFIDDIENRTYDLRFRMRGALPADGNIAIVAIDEKSLSELGRFPWSRHHIASLIDVVSDAGARAVLFDVFFPEAEGAKADAALAGAIRRSGITTLAVFFEHSEQGEIVDVTGNLPILGSAAKNISHINMTTDHDGVVRWSPLMVSYLGRDFRSLGLTGAMETLGAADAEFDGIGTISIKGRAIPVDPRQRMLINYSGPPGHYRRFSFSDVLKGRVDAREIKGKTLLIGATATGIYDLRVTPYSNNTPGVEVNANIIDNILRGDFIRRGGMETLFDLGAIVVLSFAVFIVILRVRPLIAFPFALTVSIGYSYIALKLFIGGMWVSMLYPVLSVMLTYSLASSVRFFVLEKSARQIRRMFSSYASDKVVAELVKNPAMARVGGEKKVISIMFCDLKGYTRFSERHSPEDVVGTLNEFFTELIELIMKHDGTLDKIMGDGVMAFWGAPLTQDDHPRLALECAAGMTEMLDSLNEKWRSEGRETFEVGIGINMGEVVVGNIGVEGKKMDYTAIGDAVNVTFRLQELSRKVGKPVATEAIIEAAGGVVETEYLGTIKVKGREAPVSVHAVIDLKR